MGSKFKSFLNLFKDSWTIFAENHPIKFASSFAYFSLFGLPSIFLITILTLSLFFDKPALFTELGKQLESVIGKDSADIMVQITHNYMEAAQENLIKTFLYTGTVFLLSTQLLKFFQDMLNDLWQIKPNFKSIWQKQLVERGLTFIMVLITGLLFFVSSAAEALVDFIAGGDRATGVSEFIINAITILFVYIWFAVLYKFLPFARHKWEPSLVGAAVTCLLFLIGTWLLWEFAVEDNSLEEIFDYVTPIVLISFWIFYNSLAFLFGASFTMAYAQMQGKEIKPKSYAYRFKTVPADDQEG